MPQTTSPAPFAAPDADSKTVRAELFPFRLLGMGLWIVWQWCTHWTVTLYATGVPLAGGVDYAAYDLTMRVVDIATMVSFALLWRRFTPLLSYARLQAIALGCVALGTAGLLASINGLVPGMPAAILLSALAAFGGAVLFLSWAEVYSRLEPNRMLLMGLLSLVLAGAVSFVLNNLASPLPLAGSVAAPALSFLLCWASDRYVAPREADADAPARVRYGFPWKPVAVMAFAGFTAGFGSFTLFGQTASTRMLATFVVGAVLLVALAAFRGKVKPGHLANTAFALTAVGLILVAAIGSVNPKPAAFLIMVAYITLCVFGLSLLGNLSLRFGISSLWLFGLGRAASELMMGLGSYARFIPGAAHLAENGYELAILSLVELVCLVLVVMLWRSERSFSSHWAVEAIDIESGRAVMSEREKVTAGCGIVARRAGLTERELEVLEMLALGQSYQEISQGLYLSMGTVKTHVRHIYGKLGIHSREEAHEQARSAFAPSDERDAAENGRRADPLASRRAR